MEIKELTNEMNKFVKNKGWYDLDSKRPQTLKNLSISLCLEVSEVLEYFQWGNEVIDKDEFASELADVGLYLLQIASVAGIDIEDAIMNKLADNYKRKWDNSKK